MGNRSRYQTKTIHKTRFRNQVTIRKRTNSSLTKTILLCSDDKLSKQVVGREKRKTESSAKSRAHETWWLGKDTAKAHQRPGGETRSYSILYPGAQRHGLED